jgi:hypothetical protein
MKHKVFAGVLVLVAAVAGEAMAACTGTQIVNVMGLLAGMTVCKSNGSDWEWQEYHTPGGGDLIDYKKGPTDTNDPTSTVGSWSASGPDVTYNYNTGESFTYQVWQTSTDPAPKVYSFCNGSSEVVGGATLSTAASCP